MPPFTIAFAVGLASQTAVEAWLAVRQIRHVRKLQHAVPADFAASVSVEDHAKAADYTIARQRLGIFQLLYDAAVVLWLTLGGGIAAIAAWTASLGFAPVWAGTALALAALALMSLLALPFTVYRTFWLEQRFGFNRTTPATFVADLAKEWLLGGMLGGTVLAVILWVMQSTGGWWWVLGWAVWLAFTLAVTWAWPRLIAPLFNKFSPLADPEMSARIDALLQRCGFHSSGVFVMDGSRRSAHGNAYFTGLGREKRIVLFDTLLSSLSPAQAESVLAHELAHFRLRHVPKRLLAAAGMGLGGFALLGWLARQDWFYAGLGAGAPSDAKALLLFVLAVPAFVWVLAPTLAAWSRKHEFEADAFAATHADGAELASALVRLYRDNAATLTPDPLYSRFHDSHPSPIVRIERLRGAARAVRSGAAALSA